MAARGQAPHDTVGIAGARALAGLLATALRQFASTEHATTEVQ
jgi:hypothetical protein